MSQPPVTSEILDRLPPHDAQAERQVLGCLLLEPSRCVEVGQILGPDDFHTDACRRLYAHVLGLYGDGGRVDAVLLLDRLRESGDLESIGGPAFLHEVTTSVFTAGSVLSYAAIVAKHAAHRRLIRAATDALVAAYDDSQDAGEIAGAAAEAFLAAGSKRAERTPDSATVFVEALQDIVDGNERGLGRPTGLYTFDREQGGLYPGELTILAARPSMGKTALATQIALHFAEAGRHVLFVSMEMSAGSIAQRILAHRACVDLGRIRKRQLADEERRRLVDCNGDLPAEYLHLVDRPRLTTSDIRWEIMLRQQQDSVGLVVVDYLTRIQPSDPRAPRYLQVGQMTGDLKQLALEFEVPILCLAQLSRAAEAKGETRPRLSHLKESGEIEQDADVVACLHRPERIDRDDPDNRGRAYLYVDKVRNGPPGEYELGFEAATCRFVDDPPARHPEFDEFGGAEDFRGVGKGDAGDQQTEDF